MGPTNGSWDLVSSSAPEYSLEAEVPAPTCEVTIDGCETGIEYEASVVDDICKLCLLQQLLCSLWLWIMHSNNI